jgi:hypothetical protein
MICTLLCVLCIRFAHSSVLEIYIGDKAPRVFPNVSFGLEFDDRYNHPCPPDNTATLSYTPNRRLQEDTLNDARKSLLQTGFVIALGGHSAGGGTGTYYNILLGHCTRHT